MKMRASLLRGIVAAAISMVVLLPGAAQPAQATDGDVPEPTEVGQFTFTLLVGLAERAEGGLTPAEIAAVVAQVISGVRDSGDQILAEIDGIKVAVSMTALRDALGQVSLMRETDRDKRNFARDAGHAAHTAHDLMVSEANSSLPDQATLDKLGRISMTGYDLYLPARLAARQDLLFGVNEYIEMLETLTASMKPTCAYSNPGGDGLHQYSCRAYDGTVETWYEDLTVGRPPRVKRGDGAEWEPGTLTSFDHESVAAIAMLNTVRPVASEALSRLRELKLTLSTP